MASHQDLVGDYTYIKGGSEKYQQDVSLKSDGSATYREYQQGKSEDWERVGSGTWKVDEEIVWVHCRELKKTTKGKSVMKLPGFGNEEKVDFNVAVELKVKQLQTAPPAGPDAPKSRWTRVK
eukprot:TRINITY_DN1134_c0_g1_i1.p1 TRINITY_DN1134_c0_g1~~TRINITY_DN1134_c0_g1_i1.p1  ORF type:complete len:122 (+),score=48.41 TRINITY_DN1134_c0_g1_i1:153-518(+)